MPRSIFKQSNPSNTDIMLYIFHVDTGATLTFEINLTTQSVAELKEKIEAESGVLATHQVLLMSGGESLEPNARVGSYMAGTDTNPIYLFSKAAIESQTPPLPHTDYSTDVDLSDQINASLAMPATYATLVARAQLAQQCCAIAKEQTRTCERLVHDQHLQQQGWAAVVANLEDITQMFQSKAELLQQSFSQYLLERERHMQLLANFNADLTTLSKIPILPALRAQAEGLLSPEDLPAEPTECDEEVLSLLKWISAKDNQSSLEQVAEQCSRGLEQFDQRTMEALKNEVNAAIEASNMPEMKEIKGLGERLFALEQLRTQTKKLVNDQVELAHGFHQNQTRANNLGDPSVLPDLCASHRRQLAVMLENHNQLRDIRRRCIKAKEELSINIYHRLKWIMYVENKMMEVDGKLVMYHENLKRLRRHLEVLLQIHLAPQMYISAVAEVVRRRTFSEAFLIWASNLACQLLAVHSEEIAKRREFQSKFDGHFLNTLFPGLEDTPPPFATQAPTIFDSGLPKLTLNDMESLKVQLPDLANSLSTPDLNSITQFFLSKSLTEGSTDKSKENCTLMPVDVSTKEQRVVMTSDRVESETDTDEFEKINTTTTKQNMYDQVKLSKKMEVGGSQSLSSTNISALKSRNVDHSTSSSDPGSSHFPNSLAGESTPILCPVTDCADNIKSACLRNYRVTTACLQDVQKNDGSIEPSSYSHNPISSPSPQPSVECDSQRPHHQRVHRHSDSGDSSPFADPGPNDFMGTEFYMDESLPSSLSEHPSDRQHQAIVYLLQENLGNTRDEVERLRSILRTIKITMTKAVTAFHQELSILREKVNNDNGDMTGLIDGIHQALALHTRECERVLREREQELTVDHELELGDARKMLQIKDDEIQTLKQTVLEKDSEFTEHILKTRLIRQQMESHEEEIRNLQTTFQNKLDEACARADKNNVELDSSSNTIEQYRRQIYELEETLATTKANQQKLIKEATDKVQLEYKTEIETIRSRFKLMAASTVMERSPSDSSLEKIERPDVIELTNHEAILAQTKMDMEAEKGEAIRKAVEKEAIGFDVKLECALGMATKQMNEELENHRLVEARLVEQCQQYQEIIRRLNQEECQARQMLLDKIGKLEEEKNQLENKMTSERKISKQIESQVHDLEVEKSALKQELNDERFKMSQSSPGSLVDTLKTLLSTSKDDIEASESKKVRLETSGDADGLARRLEIVEIDNKRLKNELHKVIENNDSSTAKIEALEADKVRLEVELVKERSKRVFTSGESVTVSSIESRDKEMNASVALVPDSLHQDGSCLEQSRQDTSSKYREKLIKSTNNLLQLYPISLHSCNPGDSVVVLWDTVHSSYIILQESRTMYFLHSECIDTLDLRPSPEGLPKQTYVFGEVIDKQYCHAKKSENRYHVPQGTKFYRVRVKQRDLDLVASCSEKN